MCNLKNMATYSNVTEGRKSLKHGHEILSFMSNNISRENQMLCI